MSFGLGGLWTIGRTRHQAGRPHFADLPICGGGSRSMASPCGRSLRNRHRILARTHFTLLALISAARSCCSTARLSSLPVEFRGNSGTIWMSRGTL